MSDNLDNQVFDHHDNIQKYITPDEQCSILMSKALDYLGNNQDMIKYRVAHWKKIDDIRNNKLGPYLLYLITAGSQAEGVVPYYGSDIDTMAMYRHTICTDTPSLVIIIIIILCDRNITVFHTINHDTAPGYTKLKLIKMDHFNSSIHPGLFKSECGDIYMSSEFYTKELLTNINKRNIKYTSKTLKKAGPALPVYLPETPDIIHDAVISFNCHCPALLRSWLRRPRRHNWPPRNVLYDISQMDAHVVPVGCKGSDTYDQEWRICFTKAEIHLIHCLNDTQTKSFIVLKMISKQIFKSICSEITSYIMKNIVLWMCEYSTTNSLTDKHLGSMIIQAFVFLKRCVTKNFLPRNMIPERNLLNERIEPEQKLRLIETLTCFIEEGPSAVFMRIDKIRDAMLFVHRVPVMAYYNNTRRNHVEKLLLQQYIRVAILRQPCMSKEDFVHVCRSDEQYSPAD